MDTKLNKSDWTLLIIVYGVTLILNGIDYYREDNKLIEYIVDLPLSTIISIAVILIFIHLLIPKFLIYKTDYIRFLFFAILVLVFFGSFDNYIGYLTAGKSLDKFPPFLLFLQSGLYNCSDMIGLPIGILLIKKFYEGQTEYIKIEKEKKENELKLLRSQIDPHFLFNNLNTLDSLIDSNPEKAKEYINRLSLIYRYLIQTKDSEVMELSEEINFAKNYIFLIKTRFGDDYEFSIDQKTPITDKFIPTGALQTLMENVIKHNKKDSYTIKTTIIIDEDKLLVTNTKSIIKSKNESFGTGLENLRIRYKHLSNQEVVIVNREKEYKVSIPIIKLSA